MDKALVVDSDNESYLAGRAHEGPAKLGAIFFASWGKFHPETGLSVPQAAIWMVFITIFMDTLAATISTPALPYYARSFHVNNAAVGYLYVSWCLFQR